MTQAPTMRTSPAPKQIHEPATPWFAVSAGLLDPKHYAQMGLSVWILLWCIHHVTWENHDDGRNQLIGIVTANRSPRIPARMIGNDLGCSPRAVSKHLHRLECCGYLQLRRDKPGSSYEIRVLRSKKWGPYRANSQDADRELSGRTPRTPRTGGANSQDGDCELLGRANKEETIRTKETRKTRQQQQFGFDSQFEPPDWVPKDAWDAFVDMRKRTRSPMTDFAKKLAVKKLETLLARGESPEEVLNRSTFNNWKGLFEKNGQDKRYGTKQNANSPADRQQRVNAAAAEVQRRILSRT